MEGYCRGCLTSYDDPMELLQYTEKNRRLFVYSTGIQVKRNDAVAFQMCKDCFASMKAASNFKKLCRISDKKLKSYVSLKEAGVSIDFSTFLKNNDDSTLFRLPLVSGNSTPANYNKTRDEDNESTCTSIRNFMKDILQGEEMADTEARIIREVIEEEADLLDDTLDSHWLHDEHSNDNDFTLDLNFSPFATPFSVNNDHCYTPRREDTQINKYFTSISPIRHRNTNVITDLIKNNQSEKEICSANDNEQNINNLKYEVNNEKSTIDYNLPIIKEDKSMDISIDSENLIKNLIPVDEIEQNTELQSFDSLPSIPSIQNESITNIDIPINSNKNIPKFYINNEDTDYINTHNEIEKLVDDKLIAKNNEKPCTIDKNLAKALKDENARDYSLDELLVSPQVCSAASTPTINNILFGEKVIIKLDVEKSSKSEENVQDYEMIDTILQNDTDELKKETEKIKKDGLKDEKDIIKVKKISYNDQSEFDLENCYCNICQKKFLNVKALCIHSTKKHNLKIIKPLDKTYISKSRVCQHCGKEFRNRQNYHRHLKCHQKPDPKKVYKCDHCLLEFTSIYTLQHHKSSLEPKPATKTPGKFVCTICGATSKTISNFRIHERRHLKKYNCECIECGKKCYTKSELTVHMRNHTGQKPFPCSYCDKIFSRKDALIKHVKLHLDDRPFKCEYCDMKFVTTTRLRLHTTKSKKCKKKREILMDTDSSEKIDNNDVEEDNKAVEMLKLEIQLPYIDTEMSN